MEIINRRKYDPTAVDALSYIDESEGLTSAAGETDFDADGDPFAYEARLHAAIDLRRAVKRRGKPINDDNINSMLKVAGLHRLSIDDVNRLVSIL